MDKPFEYVKTLVLYYKLETCCCVVPVRIGLIFTGYFNALMAIICLEATANESYPPTIVKVQEMILEDNATKSIPILAYCVELGFSFLLLCAIYRNDLVLMRIYMSYCMAAIVMSLLVYSIVIAAIDVLVQIAIILSTAFQLYVLLLVRSMMVAIKLLKKNGDVPTLVMSSLVQKDEQEKQDTETIEKEKVSDAKNVPEIKLESVVTVPKKEAQEVPKKEVQEVPKKEVQEVPKKEVQEVPKKAVQEVPKKAVQEVPKKEVEETPSKSRSIFIKLKPDK